MEVRDEGLSLQSLAHRLEALERENVELRSKVGNHPGSFHRNGCRNDWETVVR